MNTFADPDSSKIILLELDIGQEWDFWVNYEIDSWKVNFDGQYPEITSFTGGLPTLEITRIGSVKVDGFNLAAVASSAAVVSNDSSFFFDGSDNTLYIHSPGGKRPALTVEFIGEAIGVCNQAPLKYGGGVYNGFIYDPRLKTIPNVSKQKDPSFFGKVQFLGGTATINNLDGFFDLFGEDQDLFGNAARILLGFGDQAYSAFIPVFSGYIEDVSIGPEEITISIQDKREQLSRELPPNSWDHATYPDLKDSNVGKGIPLGYGVMRNVPVVCTNEEEDPAPANYSFKLFDVTDHEDGIKAITTVYVDGVAKTPSATSLVNATFSLAAADYSPGDKVTCDCQGFVDDGGALIDNALDVLVDLLTSYYPINFNSNFFDTARWETSGSPDMGLFIGKQKKLIDVIEEITATVLGTFLVSDDGRYAHRLFDEFAPSLQKIEKEELLEVPVVGYDPTEVLTSVRVGYNRDWSESDDEEAHYIYHDTSQEEAIFRKFKTYRTRFFPTLLTSSSAAATFASKVLAFSGDVKRTFSVRLKTQVVQRVIGDLVTVAVKRRNGDFLGDVLAEVIGIDKAIGQQRVEVTLECRLVRRLPPTVYEQSRFYGDVVYGDAVYGTSQYREVS